jgi:hypothetical protein
VQNLKDEPFALIGVNVNGYDARQLKEAMDQEGLTWRSFADPGTVGRGEIAVRWNLSVTPTYYLLDPGGVIRHKWVGGIDEKVLDAALQRLIREAKGHGE